MKRTIYFGTPMLFVLLSVVIIVFRINAVSETPSIIDRIPDSITLGTGMIIIFGWPLGILTTWIVGRKLDIQTKRKKLVWLSWGISFAVWCYATFLTFRPAPEFKQETETIYVFQPAHRPYLDNARFEGDVYFPSGS